jgi:hypothetical protein
MSEEYTVHELTVQSDSKSWEDTFNKKAGSSSGTSVCWTVKPKDGKGWDPIEAVMVSIEVRKKQHAFLILDAEARGVESPIGGREAIESYQNYIKKREEANKDETRTV